MTISLSRIQSITAEISGVPVEHLIGPRRDWPVCRPRQVAFCVAAEQTRKSLTQIGHAFGGRDHTTVLHGIKAFRRRCDPDDRELYDKITAAVREERALLNGMLFKSRRVRNAVGEAAA